MNVQISPRHKAVVVPYRADVARLFPHARLFDVGGANLLALPHGLDETRLLNNLGVPVPAPILYHYDWCGGTPFEAQRTTCALMTTEPRAFVLNGLGTGKTRAALWSFDYLKKAGLAQRMVVVATISTMQRTWAREAFQHFPHLSVGVLHGTKDKRLKVLGEDHDIYVINHDGLVVLERELSKRDDLDTWTLDELALFRNGQATRSKTCRRIIQDRKWVWGMTGGPVPKDPTDAYGQIRLILPGAVGDMSFTRFREATMHKVSQWKWVAKPDAMETVYKAMQPAVRFSLDDVAELPDMVELTSDVDMGPMQANLYADLEEHSLSMVEGSTITAMNEAALRVKLFQVAGGWVYATQKGVVELDPGPRLDALVETIDESASKVIVFVPFIHMLDGVSAHLRDEGYDVAVVSGDTPQRARNQIFNDFQDTAKIKVLVAHPKCMAHGLTLTAADTIVWYVPTEDLETFDQANARIRRPGQTRKQRMVMLQGTTIERMAYKRLRQKQSLQGLLLELYENQTKGRSV